MLYLSTAQKQQNHAAQLFIRQPSVFRPHSPYAPLPALLAELNSLKPLYRPSQPQLWASRIKVVRRIAYGFHDDEYFFLKVIDASRREYVRNPVSPKVLH